MARVPIQNAGIVASVCHCQESCTYFFLMALRASAPARVHVSGSLLLDHSRRIVMNLKRLFLSGASPANPEAAHLYQTDKKMYSKKVRGVAEKSVMGG